MPAFNTACRGPNVSRAPLSTNTCGTNPEKRLTQQLPDSENFNELYASRLKIQWARIVQRSTFNESLNSLLLVFNHSLLLIRCHLIPFKWRVSGNCNNSPPTRQTAMPPTGACGRLQPVAATGMLFPRAVLCPWDQICSGDTTSPFVMSVRNTLRRIAVCC